MAAIVPVAAYQIDEEDHTQTTQLPNEDTHFDYSQRAQWLRAALLGANDGLVSIASLMMGVGAVKSDVKAMLVAGFAGSIAGACSMAIGEFVSVYSQNEVEIAQRKRYMSMSMSVNESENNEKDREMQMEKRDKLANPFQAAFASAFSFSIGAVVPLLAAAFITDHNIRLMVVMAVASLTLVVFGLVGAVVGRTNVISSCVRVLFGGWIAMAITFGFTKLLGSTGLLL